MTFPPVSSCGGALQGDPPITEKISSSRRIFCSEKFRSETLEKHTHKLSGDILVFAMLSLREKAWYTRNDNSEFVEENIYVFCM